MEIIYLFSLFPYQPGASCAGQKKTEKKLTLSWIPYLAKAGATSASKWDKTRSTHVSRIQRSDFVLFSESLLIFKYSNLQIEQKRKRELGRQPASIWGPAVAFSVNEKSGASASVLHFFSPSHRPATWDCCHFLRHFFRNAPTSRPVLVTCSLRAPRLQLICN